MRDLCKFFWIAAVCVALGEASSLSATWSDPQEVVGASNHASTPFVASDNNGNSVCVWFELEEVHTGIGSIRAAVLSGKQGIWVETSVVVQNVKNPFDNRAQPVGIDGDGNILVAWADSSNVYSSRLSNGSLVWDAPVVLNDHPYNDIVWPPFLAVSEGGRALAVWSVSPSPYVYTVYASSYEDRYRRWRSAQIVDKVNNEFLSPIYLVSVDREGNGIITNQNPPANIDVYSYTYFRDYFRQGRSKIVRSSSQTAIVTDRTGDSVIVWTELNTNNVMAGVIRERTTEVSHDKLLSFNANYSASRPSVVCDYYGNGVAVWTEASGGIGSARFTKWFKRWVVLPTLDVGGVAKDISLSMDRYGNAVAVWLTDQGDANGLKSVGSAVLDAGANSWTLQNDIVGLAKNKSPKVSCTTNNGAFSVWNTVSIVDGVKVSQLFLSTYSDLPYQLKTKTFSLQLVDENGESIVIE